MTVAIRCSLVLDLTDYGADELNTRISDRP
jgi:hypothetical protein